MVLGSEGTLGIVTQITVRLMRVPESVRTLLADFPSIAAAGDVVSDVVAAGIVPAAIEMMDTLAIEAAEEAVHAGYTVGVPAALIVELDGPAEECGVQFEQVKAICEKHGCTRLHIAGSADERAAIWRGRKAAFAAVGRISPDYFVQDGVVPRTRLAEVLDRIAEMGAEAGLRVANVFHAGDGNLHPLVLYNADAGRDRAGRAPVRGRSRSCASRWAARCRASTASAPTRPARCRRCSPTTTWPSCTACARRSTRTGCATRARCSPRRGCAASGPASTRPHPLEASGKIERL